MSKDQILKEFQKDIDNPASEKYGEYFNELLLKRAKKLIIRDRTGVIEVLREWILSGNAPLTLAALYLVEELNLAELTSELEELKIEINSGKVFKPYMYSGLIKL